MTLVQISAAITVILIMAGTLIYIRDMFKKPNVKPSLPSWIVIAITMNLAFAMYMTTEGHSLVHNACLAVSALSALMNLVAVIIRSRIKKEKRKPFSQFQIISLIASGIIMTVWVWLVWGPPQKTGKWPYICMQALLVIGYLITIQSQMMASENNESLMWPLIAFGALVALITTHITHDSYGFWNAVRGLMSASTVTFFIIRFELRARRIKT